jgi:hypothetical protein
LAKVAIIVGSKRPSRFAHPTRWIHDHHLLKRDDVEAEMLDLRE